MEVGLVGIHREEGGLTFARIERKSPVLRPALQSKQSSLCGLRRRRDRGGGGPNGYIVNVKRAADGSRKIMDEKREKCKAKNASLRNTSTDSKGTTFLMLINDTSAPVRKERLSPASKARREVSRNKLVEMGGMPDRVKSFGEINSSEDRPGARPGFVKPIRNGLRKGTKSKVDRPWRKLAWRGEKMELDSRKKSRRDRMMRSQSSEMQ